MYFITIKHITSKISIVRKEDTNDYFVKKKTESKEELKNEIEVLKKCVGCSRVIQMITFTPDYVILSLAKCTLYDETQNTVVPCSKTRWYVAQIVDGIHFLHSKNIIHRDIKQENILIGHDGYIRLSDFGLSVVCSNPRKTICGTAHFFAPEIVTEETYDYGVDVWALGVVVYELLYNQHPFFDTLVDKLKHIHRVSIKTGLAIVLNRSFDDKYKTLVFPHTKNIDEEMLRLIKQMLVRKEKRITSKQLYTCAYITKELSQQTNDRLKKTRRVFC